MITWNRRYSVISYLRSSLWVIPVFALIIQLVVKRLFENFGVWMVREGIYDLKTGFFALNAAEAHAVLDRIFTINLSCLVFTFGSLLVAIQVAGGQYTPRIIATTLLRDNVIRCIVGFFVFTMLWANRTMLQLGELSVVPQFQIFLTMVFGLGAIIAFILLIDYAAKLLRPVSLVGHIGGQGIAVIKSVYPDPALSDAVPAAPPTKLGSPDRIIKYQGKSGIVLAVNLQGLISEAHRAGIIIEILPQVGDFLTEDDPLFNLYGNADTIDSRNLLTQIALGSERTMEQDPMFAFRIEVDIALKALSPAINDPTTAVLAIDQLHRLLRMVGKRSLRAHEIMDYAGQPRIIFRTPNWEDFVHITFREIRQCGAGNIQIARRLREVVESLTQSLPEHRLPALYEELDLLDRAMAGHHLFPEDLALARIPDSQGLGATSHKQSQD